MCERDLREDDRLVGHRGVEEGIAAPIRLETPLQLGPRAHRVHGLVLDQLVEHSARAAPVDFPELEKAAIEPGFQRVTEVGFNDAPRFVIGNALQELRAHLDQRMGATRRLVQTLEQLAARRIERAPHGGQRLRRRILEIAFGRILRAAEIGGKLFPDLVEERAARIDRQRVVHPERVARHLRPRHVATCRQQLPALRDALFDGFTVGGSRRCAAMGHQQLNQGRPRDGDCAELRHERRNRRTR